MRNTSVAVQTIHWMAIPILASAVARGDSISVPVPCIRTAAGDTVMKIERITEAGDGSVQEVHGMLTAWNASRGTVSFMSALNNEIEEIRVKTISFELPKANPVAQATLPNYKNLGAINSRVPANVVSVDQSVLKFPGCVAGHGTNPIFFQGTVTFSGGTVALNGEVLEQQPAPSRHDSSDSTRPKG